ncbi:MAG TPA: oxygenase MpaB family protein [Candidatus Eisenbacteria bacterium]|nr:oxygenase MpaB family protein [Candidatus Eisenbacteria bacterium]
MSARFDVLREIERLDPERDHQRIVHLSFGYEFCWDSIRALEIALYRTYCVPSISGLLHRTGEFYRDAQRRYDDTSILVAEMCEWGYEEGRGKEALERMNWAHGHYKIANDDFLYVLSTFIYEPVRWIDAFGWRPTCVNEKLAYYYFWRAIGTRMGIHDIPPSYEAFEAWSRAYEKQTFRFAETNRGVGSATRDLFAAWFPRIAAPLVRYGIYAMLDDDMIAAFGFPRPLPGTRAALRASLKARGAFVRWMPPRHQAHFFTDDRNRTHPGGYRIGELGPRKLVAAERRHRETS